MHHNDHIDACCFFMTDLLCSAGERGHSVVLREDHGQIHFVLQSRGVESGDEVKLAGKPLPASVNVCASVHISFCPHCGAELQQVAKRYAKEYAERAAHHKQFYRSITDR